ncbi:hypothetical protein LAZ67_15001180 [Cordylochernes scorpioides]|uniref:Tc1-like transposase DDE domain-containing protein n=1 Tax=Cordylochernes scorpioides TaxID=51811 RepID=A0ABY6L9P4_9ARAC|nr:hypothetical protein LAZ67_15001180 [Cordylochernes scorpioides]
MFQQDNARTHVAGIVRTFLHADNVRLLPWSARPPDLSPIENVWSMVSEQLASHHTLIHHRKKRRINGATVLQAAQHLTTAYKSDACPVATRFFVHTSILAHHLKLHFISHQEGC